LIFDKNKAKYIGGPPKILKKRINSIIMCVAVIFIATQVLCVVGFITDGSNFSVFGMIIIWAVLTSMTAFLGLYVLVSFKNRGLFKQAFFKIYYYENKLVARFPVSPPVYIELSDIIKVEKHTFYFDAPNNLSVNENECLCFITSDNVKYDNMSLRYRYPNNDVFWVEVKTMNQGLINTVSKVNDI